MDKNLIDGLIWMSKTDGRDWVRIKKVEFDSVTYEFREKINDGADYMDSNWDFKGATRVLSVEEFEAKYRYYRSFNLDYELAVARERMASAAEMLIGSIDLDTEDAEALVNLYAKTVLNEASVRIELMDWDTGCCGDDSGKAAGEIEAELTAEEIEELDG
jgi:hypothetical protein